MKELVKKGLYALLEGDRDSVLRLFPFDTDDTDILWMKANSVLSDIERTSIFSRIKDTNHPIYGPIAMGILQRESKYEVLLLETPDYKFWLKKGKA